MEIQMTKEEIRNELIHWTVYGIIEGDGKFKTNYLSAVKMIKSIEEVEFNEDEYLTLDLIDEVLSQVKKFYDEE